jgi:hypothetical protein
MNEKLQKWSLIAEIVGGIGVFITLIVLVFEVRANSELTKTLAFQQEIRSLNEWRNNIASSPDHLRVFNGWSQRELPDPGSEDSLLLQLILVGQVTNYESAYYSRASGILGDTEWDRVERSLCGVYREAQSSGDLWNGISPRLTNEFSLYVENNC